MFFILPFALLNLDFCKPYVSKILIQEIQKKLTAKIKFTNLSYRFKKFKLFLTAQEISIEQNDDKIVELHDFKLVYPLRNLFRSTQMINNIFASRLYIKAIKNNDLWNLESILKPSKRSMKFRFKALSFHETELEIFSEQFYEKELVYLDIHKNKSTKLYDVEFYNNKDLQSSKLTDASLTNQFYISGIYDLNNAKGVYKLVQNLNVNFHKLQPNLINLISRAFSKRKSRFLEFFNRYAQASTQVNLKLSENQTLNESYSLSLAIANLKSLGDININSKFLLADDINLEFLDLYVLGSHSIAKGVLKNAFKGNPVLDLNIDLQSFNLPLFRSRIQEIQTLITDKVMKLINVIHSGNVFDLNFKIIGDFFQPEIVVDVPIKNLYTVENSVQKNFKLDLQLLSNEYKIKKLMVPFEYSDFILNGTVAKSGNYELNLFAQDLPLRSLRLVAESFLETQLLEQYKDLLFKGYLKSDLKIKKTSSNSAPSFYGELVFVETSILEPNFPLLVQNINTKIVADGDSFTVLDFAGKVYENDIDFNATYNMASKDLQFNLSSDLFDLTKIESFHLKKYIKGLSKFKTIVGNIENLQLNYKSQANSLIASGLLNNLGFDFLYDTKTFKVSDLNSSISFVDNVLTVQDLSLIFNDNGNLSFDGTLDLANKVYDFSSKAVNFPFDILSYFSFEQLGFKAKEGLLDYDLSYKDKKLKASGLAQDISFYTQYQRLPGLIRLKNGAFSIDDDLRMNGATVFYENSQLDIKEMTIQDFLTKDRYFDFDVDSKLKYADFVNFIPETIAQLLKVEGYLPVNFQAKGNSQKFYLDINGSLDEVDSLKFAQWLEFDPTVKARAKSSFYFTPKTILSKNTKLFLTKNDVTTELITDFEVHDWKQRDKINYSIDAYTPLDTNGNFLAVDLDPIEPHIKSIETLNLDPGTGYLQCRTDGNYDDRHTFCDIEFLDQAIAKKFAVGDLSSQKSSVNLISVKDKPVFIKVKLLKGLWNILDYKKVRFDMQVTEDFMQIDRLRAKLEDGFIRANLGLDFHSLVSKFKIKGNNISAHKAMESFFALGNEVPQGIASGQFEGQTKGLLPDEMFFNLEGEASVLLKDGKLSSLNTMQKLLSAVNTLKNFDFNNVFQTIITYKGGLFNDIVSHIIFDKGKMQTEKLILHSDQIELHLEGFVDYAADGLMIRGLGAVPERSKSILQLVGIKSFNLGNLLSIINLRNPGADDKDYFAFMMRGPVTDIAKTSESLRRNFTWLRTYGPNP